MHPETNLALQRVRAAGFRAEADAYQLAAAARQHRCDLRARLGWTLVEVGLRLVATPKPAVAR